MDSWLKILFGGIKVFILFTGSTIVFYLGMVWVSEEYQYYHRYDEPEKGAVKASTMYDQEEQTWWDRITLFYLNGE